nr:MAG TPA: hypothetical protein [Caudoviricetes sp.]
MMWLIPCFSFSKKNILIIMDFSSVLRALPLLLYSG